MKIPPEAIPFCWSKKLALSKVIRIFSAFCSRLRAGYEERLETSDSSSAIYPTKKIKNELRADNSLPISRRTPVRDFHLLPFVGSSAHIAGLSKSTRKSV